MLHRWRLRYGPHDNFDLASAHVLPAMIRKCHDAKIEGRREMTIWGTGSPKREFLHVDDLADACAFLMPRYQDALHINVGTGEQISIADLAGLVRRIVHPDATIVYDTTKPEGSPASGSTSHGRMPLAGDTARRSPMGLMGRTSGSSPIMPPHEESRFDPTWGQLVTFADGRSQSSPIG